MGDECVYKPYSIITWQYIPVQISTAYAWNLYNMSVISQYIWRKNEFSFLCGIAIIKTWLQ